MTSAGTSVLESDVVAAVGAELAGDFAGEVGQEAIAGAVVLAVSDLRGSVTAGSLPEMASRLARVRLASVGASG